MAKHNIWMSVSDLMTGLMVIFLFVTIAYMNMVKDSESILTEYMELRKNLHDRLVQEFAGDTTRWKASIGTDLSMKFHDPKGEFEKASFHMNPVFRQKLDEFIPRYLEILLSSQFRDNIKEIRIEGHTDPEPAPQYHPDPFIANTMLSQLRTVEVLHYIRNMPTYKAYSDGDKRLLEYLFTANGLSYSKALDEKGEYAFISHAPIDEDKSRRVEFRIITKGDEVFEEFIRKNNQSKVRYAR